MGEAVMVPGPLPRQTDEPRPTAWIELRSQPVAVVEGQGGRPLPIWVGRGLVGVAWLGTEVEAVPHPPTRVARSRTRPDRVTLDKVVIAATDP